MAYHPSSTYIVIVASRALARPLSRALSLAPSLSLTPLSSRSAAIGERQQQECGGSLLLGTAVVSISVHCSFVGGGVLVFGEGDGDYQPVSVV